MAYVQHPNVVAVPGQPTLILSNFDLAPLGYATEEFFISGTASSYKLPGPPSSLGVWNAEPAATAPFTTRIVVVRPTDPGKFNGTDVVEWLNVSGGIDAGVDWNTTHREITRNGSAYVGVSAQKVGIDGGFSITGSRTPLKKANRERYGRLVHPGDAFSYMFSHAGRDDRRENVDGYRRTSVAGRLGSHQSEEALGSRIDASFRLWFIDHAQHTAPVGVPGQARTISYQGVLEQALRDVSAWVERGVRPPSNTNYSVVDGQVQVSAQAAQRGGIQPVVSMKVNGRERVDVVVGEPVSFVAEISAPPGTGRVVAAEWDLLGVGAGCGSAGHFRSKRIGEDHLFVREAGDLFPGASRHVTTRRRLQDSLHARAESRPREGRREVERVSSSSGL